MDATTARAARGSMLTRLLYGPSGVRAGATRSGLHLVFTDRGDVIATRSPWPALLRRCALLLAVLALGAVAGLFVPTAAACGCYAIGAVDARLRG